MSKKIKIKTEENGTVLIMDGVVYKAISQRGDTTTYEELDRSIYDRLVHQLAVDLVKVSDLNLVAVLESALKEYHTADIDRIRRSLDTEVAKATEEGRKPKVVKEPGCMGIQIGDPGRKVGSFVQIVG